MCLVTILRCLGLFDVFSAGEFGILNIKQTKDNTNTEGIPMGQNIVQAKWLQIFYYQTDKTQTVAGLQIRRQYRF